MALPVVLDGDPLIRGALPAVADDDTAACDCCDVLLTDCCLNLTPSNDIWQSAVLSISGTPSEDPACICNAMSNDWALGPAEKVTGTGKSCLWVRDVTDTFKRCDIFNPFGLPFFRGNCFDAQTSPNFDPCYGAFEEAYVELFIEGTAAPNMYYRLSGALWFVDNSGNKRGFSVDTSVTIGLSDLGPYATCPASLATSITETATAHRSDNPVYWCGPKLDQNIPFPFPLPYDYTISVSFS